MDGLETGFHFVGRDQASAFDIFEGIEIGEFYGLFQRAIFSGRSSGPRSGCDEGGIEGAQEKANVVEDDPGDVDPSRVVGVEFDFAMAVQAEEGVEARGKVAEGRKEFLFDDFAGSVIAEELEERGSAENFFGEGIEFGVDHAGLGFAEGEERIVETGGIGGPDGEDEEMVKDAMKDGLRDGDGDVGLKVVGAEFADFFDVTPEGGNGLGLEGPGHEFADADEVAVEVAGPEEGEFLDPTVIFADLGNGGFDIGERFEAERDAFEVKVDGVLVSVDVVVEHAEPFALERRETHQAERVSE